jgi:hypothetical protein
MFDTTRLAVTRREVAGPQVSPAVGQSVSVRQRRWLRTHIFEITGEPLVMQTSLENTMQMSSTAPVHCESEVHLGLLQSCEQMPRHLLPLPQSASLVQEVALLLTQKPRQVLPVPQSESLLQSAG